MGSSESKQQASMPAHYQGGGYAVKPQHSFGGQAPRFPTAFTAFFTKYHLKSMELVLGYTKEDPLYSVSMPWGYYGKMFFHGGPNPKTSPAIATCKNKGKGYTTAIQMDGGISIELKPAWHGAKYNFSCPVGRNGNWEEFQWKAVKLAVKGQWALTRLSTGEVVATFQDAYKSLSKGLNFAFEGAGADGSLGPVFHTLAVVTGLRTWQVDKHMRDTSLALSNTGVYAAAANA
jgi:hypothetical protein